MTEHPLTDELCDQIVSSTPPLPRDHQDRVLSYDGRILDGMFEECFEVEKHQMRAAADWQLDKVLEWLNGNLSNYTDDTYLGDCYPLHNLERHLKEAMRPQNVRIY
jgi:hypothetical protein